MEDSLRDMLKHGRKWERHRVDDSGIFIRKIPRSKENPAYLAVEINPIGDDGFPVHKMGIVIRSKSELDAIRVILSSQRVDEAFDAIERITQT